MNEYILTTLTKNEANKLIKIAESFISKGVSETPPNFVILMGGICSGKTTLRQKKYSEGYVNFDYGEIDLVVRNTMGKEDINKLADQVLMVSDLILKESFEKKKNIVIEIIGDINYEQIAFIVEKVKELGYKLSIETLVSDIEESRKSYQKISKEQPSYTSAFHTQEATLEMLFHQLNKGNF